jgi:Tfp pilus assembly protein PilX
MRLRTLRHDEGGYALVGSLMLILVMAAFGATMMASLDTQQAVSGEERIRESSFNLAEAALAAHALQVSRSWPGCPGGVPGETCAQTTAAPTACSATATTTVCPDAPAVNSGYTGTDYGQPCATAPTTPAWQTAVRDNVAGEQYWTTAVNSRLHYDANADGIVWMRSSASVRCEQVSVVAQVTRNQLPMAFPTNTITANWFATSNQGRKVIVDTVGAYAQPPSIRPTGSAAKPGSIVARCTGMTETQCLSYERTKGQVQPPATRVDAGTSSTILSPVELDALERQAKAGGKYFQPGTCPTTAASLSSTGGVPVVVAGPCTITLTTGIVNSAAAPGALIVQNGTLTLGGNSLFYGLLYMLNKQGSSGAVVSIEGNATLQGVVAVDGLGGVKAGSSKTNIVFDPRAASLLRGDAGANVNKNTFRVLPGGTP